MAKLYREDPGKAISIHGRTMNVLTRTVVNLCSTGGFGRQTSPREMVLISLDAEPKELNINAEYIQEQQKRLGEGQYASVYSAMYKSTRETCAVKCIPKEKVLKDMDIQQLRAEIDILQRAEHPYIVKFHNAFEDNANVYLVMELLKGGELFDKIVEQKSFSETTGAFMMRQVLEAISYLHANFICHRDVKAENFVFLHAHRQPVEKNVLKLIDFGYSRRFSIGERFKTFVGSPDYVAPQVIKGDYDPACDLWSIGVLMYVLLYGLMPFCAPSPLETVMLISKGTFSLSPESRLSKEAKELISRLMEMNERIRWGADMALRHVWIQKGGQMNEKERTVSGLKNPNCLSGICQICC